MDNHINTLKLTSTICEDIPATEATSSEILAATMLKIEGAYSPSTIRAYRANFASFITYCAELGVASLPASATTIASYISYLSDGHLKSASIRIAVTAIATIHRLNRLDDPVIPPPLNLS